MKRQPLRFFGEIILKIVYKRCASDHVFCSTREIKKDI